MTGIVAQRPRFVDGTLLSAEDLTLEQSYLDRRVQQFGTPFGCGVVEGMQVELREKEQIVTITPGWAVDAKGREILLTREAEEKADNGVLCVRWREPDKLSANAVSPLRAPSNSSSVIRLIARSEICVFEFVSDLGQALLEGWVPIADVNVGEKRVMRITRLTGVSKISWTHGKSKTAVPDNLWVEFSAPLKSFPLQALDIRIRADGTETLAVVKTIAADRTGTRWSFDIEPQQVRAERATVFIRLACDFILDLKGDPVSGAHLGGTLLRGGNGVPGGVFESWFLIDGAAK